MRFRAEPRLEDFDILLVSWPSGGEDLKAYAARQTDLGTLELVKRLEKDGVWSELYVKR